MKDTATEVKMLGSVQCRGCILFLNMKIHVYMSLCMVLVIGNPFFLPPLKQTTDKYLLSIALKRCPTIMWPRAPSLSSVRQWGVKTRALAFRKLVLNTGCSTYTSVNVSGSLILLILKYSVVKREQPHMVFSSSAWCLIHSRCS